MTSIKQQILDQFEVVRRHRDEAQNDLSQAQETITLLEAELAAVKYYGDLAYAKVTEEQGISKKQIEHTPEVKVSNAATWIDDVWFCTSDHTDILRPAEEAWAKNLHNPQSAILLVTEALKTKPAKKDRLRCKLLMVAIQVSAGLPEPACAGVNECINECGTDPRFKDIAGIAYYIRGRIFLALEYYRLAHWDFSRAVFTKGYHEQVKKWQGYCETCILEGKGVGEGGQEEVLQNEAVQEDVQWSSDGANP
ncbi:hypothetical protein EPUS_02734 [Endocarpon pusillum Z07020]|uniref:Uncharacterized protein n=1 Tax=Endocarpon pusillum (strain Z07020 / HMAS-L-300199) TaxID=1263415 RepID=U1G8F6_ENDPU|nr:uncharacterized protein EPUS_02734 [Endocarpon pusillum Z07020]ERF68278.1 hypothetical protein EPUS_02734 [Endocarpon pusillum Z07020]